MRSAAAVCAVTLVALAAVAVLQRTSLGFTLGVAPAIPVAALEPGRELCQGPIVVPPGGAFDRVALTLGAEQGPGPELPLRLRELESRRVLAESTVRGGYRGVAEHRAPVRRVPDGREFDVCLTNRGDGPVAVYGNPDAASRTSTARVDGEPLGMDVSLRFDRSSRSMASLLDDMAARAALFKPSWTGAWTSWLLGALVLLAVPALLLRAVRDLRE